MAHPLEFQGCAFLTLVQSLPPTRSAKLGRNLYVTQFETLVNHMNHEIAADSAVWYLAFNAEIANIPGIVRLTSVNRILIHLSTWNKLQSKALKDESHYAPSNGTLALRTAAAEFLALSMMSIMILLAKWLSQLVRPGAFIQRWLQSLILGMSPDSTPIFPLYIAIVKLSGATPVFMDTSDNGFVLSPDQLQTTLAATPDESGGP